MGPGIPGSSPLHGSSTTQPADGDRTPRAQTRVLHAESAPHALFPFSASGIGLFSRRAESRWPRGPRVLRKPELPATSSARRGGGEPSKLPRRRAERIPEEKPLCKKPKPSAPPPSCDLPSSCLGTALLSSHLRPS